MYRDKIIILYLLLLMNHVAHILEEIWGRMWLIDSIFGVGWFLLGNWVLFCVPAALFYFIINEKKWAYSLGMIYGAIMVVNGIGHNVATLLTGRYFGGFAGCYTGIGLIIVGGLLIYHLNKGIQLK